MDRKSYNTNDPRVVRTRKQIMQAFVELMCTKTIEDFSVTDISREGQINRTTFYSYYYDKYDLFEDVVDQAFMENLKNESKECTSAFSESTLKALLFSARAYYIKAKSSCKQEHINVISLAEKVVLHRSKEFLEPYMNDVYFDKLTVKQKEMWLCSACHAIIGVAFEYAESLTDDMIYDQIRFLLAFVS